MKTLQYIIKTLAKRWILLVSLPLAAALVVFVIMSGQPKMYKSSSTIYTGIVSGYDVLATESNTHDWMSVNNAIDNLMSVIMAESTLSNVSMRLLARNICHLENEDSGEYMTKATATELRALITPEVRALTVPDDEEETFENYMRCFEENRDNWFKQMFHWNHRHYSFTALSKIEVTRVGNSDMIRLSYTCDDQYVAYNTLTILETEFVKQYLAIRYQQTSDVVKYFENELKTIQKDLTKKEDALTSYNINKGVINYGEQTKMVAERQKDLDGLIEMVMRERDGAEEKIRILEEKMGFVTNLYTNNASFIGQLHTINNLYTQISVQDSTGNVNDLNSKISEETDKLKAITDEISVNRYSKEGLSNELLVSEWISALLMKSKADAELDILFENKKEMDNEVKRFSPIGSSLKRQEREINFSEQNYLSNLKALNDAKLREKNLQLTSATFRVLTPPTVALYPEKTKTKLFAMIAFLFTFVLLCGIVIVMEEFNRKPYDAAAAQKLINLPVIGAYPHIKGDSANMEIYKTLSMRHLGNSITNYFDRNQNVNIINVFSVGKSEGKSTVCRAILEYFESLDTKPVMVNWENDFESNSKYYLLANSIYDFSVNENNMEAMPEANVIIVEYPPLKEASFPTKVLNTSAINILVTDSGRDWTGMNSLLIGELKRFNKLNNIGIILNNSDIDTVGSFTGMLPPFSRIHKIRFKFWNFGADHKA
ncbi:MAG: GumC family protein [Candidatus Cryptobacteroides sp.]